MVNVLLKVQTTNLKTMAIPYGGINYFPVGVNFMEENAMEVIEAKYGIKSPAIVLKLLCKIYKEGYFIHWDEEQCLIFANKAGREVQAAEVQGIIEILFIKGILDRNSYLANGILTSANIQKIWMEATKRKKKGSESIALSAGERLDSAGNRSAGR